MTDRDPWCGESLAGHFNGLCHCHEILALRQQLAETKAHLEAQRLETYHAVEREHALRQQLAEVNAFIDGLTESAPITQRDSDWVMGKLKGKP